MKYSDFVKANYAKVSHLPAKQRMKAIAQLWKKQKGQTKGAGIFGDVGNAVDGIGSMFGLGLEKRKRGRPAKKTQAKGAGIFGDVGNAVDSVGSLFGLGLEKKGRGRPRKSLPNKSNGELMQAVAELRKKHSKGGSLGDVLKSVAPILPLLAL